MKRLIAFMHDLANIVVVMVRQSGLPKFNLASKILAKCEKNIRFTYESLANSSIYDLEGLLY